MILVASAIHGHSMRFKQIIAPFQIDSPLRNRLSDDFMLAIISLILVSAAGSVAPFAVYRFATGNLMVGLLDAALVSGMLIALAYVWRTGKVRAAGIVASGFANLMAVFAILAFGMPRDWLYTTLIATFLVAPRWFAVSSCVLVILAIAGWPTDGISAEERLTFASVAVIVSLFSLIFASGVFRRHAELSREASLDPLTGVGNRRALALDIMDLPDSAFEPAGLGLVLLDIDHFKMVNDRHGHDAGDQVLVSLAGILRRSLRTTDRIFRHGGEEFIVLLPGVARDDLPKVVEKLMSAIRTQLRGPEGAITVSMGAVAIPEREEFSRALARADRAMYQAKDERDSWVLA